MHSTNPVALLKPAVIIQLDILGSSQKTENKAR